MIKSGQKYLITTDSWFIAPDGEQYRSAWGTCQLKNIEEVFGFSPSRPSTNWYLEIGKDGKEIVVAGCQIHYAVRSEEIPSDKFKDITYTDKDTQMTYQGTRIYLAEKA